MSVGDAPAEIRVHGVGGPQARKMLGLLNEEDVVTLPPFRAPNGGALMPQSGESRFARRAADDGTEAYEWGGLTTGSWTKALWILYLPFTLVNAAGWAHHAPPRSATLPFTARVHLLVAHVLAGLATVTYVLWIAYLVLDLVAVRWKEHVLRAGEVGDGIARDAVQAWLPVFAPVVFALVVIALALAPVRRGRFEEVGAPPAGGWGRGGVPEIGDRTFFAHAESHQVLLTRHLVVGGVAAAAAFLQFVVGWNRLGLALLLLGAAQGLLLLTLLVVDAWGRQRHQPLAPQRTQGEPSDGLWYGPPWLPVGASFALLGVVTAHAAFTGMAMLLQPLLADWPGASPVDSVSAAPELGMADVFAWTLVLLALGFVGILLAIRGKRSAEERGIVVMLARRVHLLAPVVWAAVVIPFAYFVVRNSGDIDFDRNPWTELVRWYDGEYTFNSGSLFQRLGSFLLVSLPALVFLVLRGGHDRGPARVVGNVWDVLTFWPRRFHPLAAPPYAERAVPELRARLEHTVASRGPVLLSAHSQGSVLAAAAIASADLPQGTSVALVTFGSPLGTLFSPTWPAYVPPLLQRVAGRVGPGAWSNFWRATDPVGAGIPWASNFRLPDPQEPSLAELADAANRVPLERPGTWGSTAGHGRYLADPAVRREIARWRRPGTVGPGTPTADRSRWKQVCRWAHQGGAKEGPSNTLWAMSGALGEGSDPRAALELDVHRSRDGALVVIHDRTLDRTTSGSGKVRSRTLSEIRALDAAYWWVPGKVDDHRAPERCYPLRGCAGHDPTLQVPTLDDVLEAFPDVALTIEVKSWRAVRPLVDRLAPEKRRDVTITSFADPIVWWLRWKWRRRPERPPCFAPGIAYTAWFVLRVAAGLAPRSSRYERLQIPPHLAGVRLATKRVVDAAHRADVCVDVWTVDDPATMEELLALGVDGIMTDVPTVLDRVIGIERGDS